jgi:zinc protease
VKLIALTTLMAAAALAQAPAPARRTGTPALPRVADLKFEPLRQVKIPEITTFTLPNGMRVYMLENHELPVISGSALVRTGNLFDPPDKVGLAGFTGSVMRTGGTKARTGEQIDETLENMAASVEAGIGETSGSVSFNALKENTADVLQIFKEVLTQPAFRQDKLDLAKTQTRSALARRNDDPDAISNREFASVVYGRDNPYGWDQTYEHVDNIKREDLVNFYERYFFPSNVMLSVYGDFDTKEMRARIEKLFADWTVKQEPVPAFPAVKPQAAAPGVYQATKTDVTQTFFELGHLGGLLRDKDYPALSVMSDILGGGFASRLFLEVRTRKGLAYNVGGGWGANYGHPGLFRIGGSTKSNSTVEALQSIRAEVDKIRTAEVTDQELQTAKQSVLNSFVFFFDHPRKILTRYVTYEYWGYPRDFIFQYQKAVEAVTKADVLRVAKAHLKPEMFTVVAVGNPKEYGKALTLLGPVKELDIELPQPGRKTTQATPDTIARGRQLLQRVQQAMGGADKLAAVKDATTTAEVSIASGPGGGMKVKQTAQWVAPGTMRQTQEFPFGKLVAVWNGTEGWVSSPQGTMPMPPPVQQQIAGELFRMPMLLYTSDRDPERTVNAVGPNAIEVSNKVGQRVRIEVDATSGLPASVSYTGAGPQGPQPVTAVYGDWRAVGGIQVPHKITILQGEQKFAEAVVADVKFNSGLNAAEVGSKP